MPGVIVLFAFCLVFIAIATHFKINNRIITFVFILVTSLLAATRYITISDSQEYANQFSKYGPSFKENLNLSYFEPGFVFFATIIKLVFGNSYRVFFWIISLVDLTLIYFSIKMFYENEITVLFKNDKELINSPLLEKKLNAKYIVPMIMYMGFFGFFSNFITLRVGLAFSIAFFSIMLYEKNKIISILIYIISITFHTSTSFLLISIPFLIFSRPYAKKTYLSWFLLLPFLLLLGYSNVFTNLFFNAIENIPVLYVRFAPHVNKDIMIMSSTSFIRVAIYLLISLQLIANNRGSKKYNYLLKCYLLGLTIYVMFINITIIGRIVEIFTTLAFVLPSYYMIVYKKRRVDIILMFIYLLYFSTSFLRTIT